MSKAERIKSKVRKFDVSGSETIGERIKGNTPWVFGSKRQIIRKPRMKFPKMGGRRFSIPMPGKAIGLILIFAILFILQTGIVYIIYREPNALGADNQGNAIFLYPSIHDSFIVEGIVASILIFVASCGYLLIYQASKYSYDRTAALRIMVIGILLVVIGFISLQYMISQKTGG